jgi:hypothetical protein
MTDIPYTQEEGAIIDGLIGWALDQDHDAQGMGDPDYLFFLANEEEGQTTDQVREILHGAFGKASRGVTQEDVDEVAADDGELRGVYVVIEPEGEPEEWHVEVLSEAPKWNTYGQIVRVAGIDGGDSSTVHPQPGTAERADVTRRLAQAFGITAENRDLGSERALLRIFSIVTGIVNEYRDDGDQMAESCCICQVGPGGHRILNPVCPEHGVRS